MPKGKSYSVYVEGADQLDPGTKVKVEGDGVVQKDGTVLVQSFTTEDGPNSADAAMNGMGSTGAGMLEGVLGDGSGE